MAVLASNLIQATIPIPHSVELSMSAILLSTTKIPKYNNHGIYSALRAVVQKGGK